MARRLVLQAAAALLVSGGIVACASPTAPSPAVPNHVNHAMQSGGGGVIIGSD